MGVLKIWSQGSNTLDMGFGKHELIKRVIEEFFIAEEINVSLN